MSYDENYNNLFGPSNQSNQNAQNPNNYTNENYENLFGQQEIQNNINNNYENFFGSSTQLDNNNNNNNNYEENNNNNNIYEQNINNNNYNEENNNNNNYYEENNNNNNYNEENNNNNYEENNNNNNIYEENYENQNQIHIDSEKNEETNKNFNNENNNIENNNNNENNLNEKNSENNNKTSSKESSKKSLNIPVYIASCKLVHLNNIPYVYYLLKGNLVSQDIYRRYADFEQLREKLVEIYPCIYIPGLPPKRIIGSQDTKISDMKLKLLNHFLKKLTENKELLLSPVTKIFFSKDPNFRFNLERLKRGNAKEVNENFKQTFTEFNKNEFKYEESSKFVDYFIKVILSTKPRLDVK